MTIGIVISQIIVIALGYTFIAFIDSNKTTGILERCILGYLVGQGWLTIILQLMGLMHIPITLTTSGISIVAIITLVIRKIKDKTQLYKIKRSTLPQLAQKKHRIIIGVISGLILVYKIAIGFIFVLQSPTYQDDSLDKRNMRAKVFYEKQSLVLNKKDSDYLGMVSEPYDFEKEKSIPLRSYPPNNSLSKTRIAIRMGEFKDPQINVVNPIFYSFFLGALIILIAWVTQNTGRGILSAAIVSGIPYLRIHGTNPYAELFVAGYVAVTGLLLIGAIKQKNKLRWNLLMLVHPLILVTKKEGFVIAGFVLIIIGLYQRSLAKYSIYKIKTTIIETIKKTWLYIATTVFRVLYQFIIGYGTVFLSHHSNGVNQFHPEIFQIYKHVITEQGNYNIIALIAIIVIIFGRKVITKTYLKYGYLLFLLIFMVIFYSLSSTGAFVEAQQQVGINRAFISYMPLLVVLLILTTHEYFKLHKINE